MPVVESQGHLVAYRSIDDLQAMLCKDRQRGVITAAVTTTLHHDVYM
jgi:hypothetical protein